MLVDSHCHLDFPDFAGELDAIVGRARDAGVGRMVTISTKVKKHDDLIAIAERFPDVYCSVGTHPHSAHEELDVTTADLVARTRHPKVVAIGEAGLDYHYDYSPRDAQERGVGRMVTISTKVKKHDDLIAIAERFPDVYCSVGTHPHSAHEELDVTTADLVARTRHPKVVAIGEAGLDYHYDYSPRDAQERG